MTDERRRITWGDKKTGNSLDPFVIDRDGLVFNTRKDGQEPVKQMDISDAFGAWKKAVNRGTGRKSPRPDLLFESEEDMVKEVNNGFILHIQHPTDDFIGPPQEWYEPVWEKCSGCRYLDRTPSKLTTKEINRLYRERSIPMRTKIAMTTRVTVGGLGPWIPLAGNMGSGWILLYIPDRFSTIFHGPSMAAMIFK